MNECRKPRDLREVAEHVQHARPPEGLRDAPRPNPAADRAQSRPRALRDLGVHEPRHPAVGDRAVAAPAQRVADRVRRALALRDPALRAPVRHGPASRGRVQLDLARAGQVPDARPARAQRLDARPPRGLHRDALARRGRPLRAARPPVRVKLAVARRGRGRPDLDQGQAGPRAVGLLVVLPPRAPQLVLVARGLPAVDRRVAARRVPEVPMVSSADPSRLRGSQHRVVAGAA